TVLKGEQEFFKRNPFLEIFKTEQKLNCYVELKDGKINFTLNPPAANSPSSTVAFYGKTDRIDVNKRDNAFYIIDYKKSITPKKPEIEDGRKVQLLLYMAAASLIFPEIKAGGGCYISLSKASTGDNPKSWRLIIGNIDDGICPPRSKTGRSCITLNEGTFYEDIAGILAKKAVGALKGITEGIFSIDPVQDISSDEEDEYSSSTEREICGICDYKRCCGVKYWY
ncbi:MAG: PD-(D/E)XK nuclease family protein, partial [bacterium]